LAHWLTITFPVAILATQVDLPPLRERFIGEVKLLGTIPSGSEIRSTLRRSAFTHFLPPPTVAVFVLVSPRFGGNAVHIVENVVDIISVGVEDLIEVRAGGSPKRDVRANEVANPDHQYLLSPPEDDSQDRSRTVDDRP
jgi:hypothetical protein